MSGAADRVEEDEILLRGLHPDWLTTGDDGQPRVSSSAFKDRTEGGLSLYRKSMTTFERVVALTRRERFAGVRAGDLRAVGGHLELDPEDPSHVLVTFPGVGTNRMQKLAKVMALKAVLLDEG
jgi:hypothetical protein